MPGKIYVVATPIGSLEDITFRAVNTLKNVDFIAAEDTRVSKKLLAHLGITKPIYRFDDNINDNRIESIAERVLNGESLAVVTDAGTPNVSDPGYRLISAALKMGVEEIHPIPGPSALTALVSVSHFSMDSFVFLSYPPAKKGRKKFFDEVVEEKKPVIFYESPHRIEKSLKELSTRLPKRDCIVAKELTKIYEKIWRGTVEDVNETISNLSDKERKGEWVVAISQEHKNTRT